MSPWFSCRNILLFEYSCNTFFQPFTFTLWENLEKAKLVVKIIRRSKILFVCFF